MYVMTIHTYMTYISLIPPREDQCEWHRMTRMTGPDCVVMCNLINTYIRVTGRPGSSEVPRNPLTRWDVSSIPANGIFLTKKNKNKIKTPDGWRTIKSLEYTKFDFTVDEGKDWQKWNPSREKN